jgi:transposase-like protein
MKVPAEYVTIALDMYYKGAFIKNIRKYLKQEHHYYPSKSVVHWWIKKYTDLAMRFNDCHLNIGDSWIIIEDTFEVDGKNKVWIYDIIDEKTRFLLASHVATSRTTYETEMIVKEGLRRAGKMPKEIVIDKNYLYPDAIKNAFGNTVRIRKNNDSNELLERLQGTEKNGIEFGRPFKYIKTLIRFIDGWLIYYNFFKPNKFLGGKTPAEESHINCNVNNWADFIYLGGRKR